MAVVDTVLQLFRDIRYALRIYCKEPFTTTLALLALSLAIGVCTGIVSVVNALFVRSLPFADSAHLVELSQPPFSAINGRTAFKTWSENNSYLESAATFSTSDVSLFANQNALRATLCEASANFFTLIGIGTMLGRTFVNDEDVGGGEHVAIISYRLWRQVYGKDAGALGMQLRVNSIPLVIVGVAPPGFDYPARTDVWTATAFDLEVIPKQGALFLHTIGRLKPGVTFEIAQQNFRAQSHTAASPSFVVDEPDRSVLVPIRDQINANSRRSVLILACIVSLALIISCANVAQMLLSRTIDRLCEWQLRVALGASRSHLVRQAVTEGTMLACAGAALGLCVAAATSHIAEVAVPPTLMTQHYTLLNWQVLSFETIAVLLMGVLFGLSPILLIGSGQSSRILVRTVQNVRTPVANRCHVGLVAIQMGLTLIIVSCSVTLGTALMRLWRTDLGFRRADVLSARVSLSGAKYASNTARWQYYNNVIKQLEASPGIVSAAAVDYLPLANNMYAAGTVELDSGQKVRSVVLNHVTPGYFVTMRTKIMFGRDFAESDGTSRIVIVNDAFARDTGLNTSLIGRVLTVSWKSKQYSIVGLVETARMAGPEYKGIPQIYTLIEEDPPSTVTLVARIHEGVKGYVPRCREIISRIDREVPVYDIETIEQRLTDTLRRPMFYTWFVIALGCLAFLLAIIGTYGTCSYTVARRKHEIGVRMALGSTQAAMRSRLLLQTLIPICTGLVAGAAGTVMSGRVLRHLINDVNAIGPATYVVTSILLLATATAATWRATGTVTRIEPSEALRAD